VEATYLLKEGTQGFCKQEKEKEKKRKKRKILKF
jgi:hypothetical protein